MFANGSTCGSYPRLVAFVSADAHQYAHVRGNYVALIRMYVSSCDFRKALCTRLYPALACPSAVSSPSVCCQQLFVYICPDTKICQRVDQRHEQQEHELMYIQK